MTGHPLILSDVESMANAIGDLGTELPIWMGLQPSFTHYSQIIAKLAHESATVQV